MKDLVGAIRIRLRMILSISILSIICGGVIGYFMPPTFEAKTELLVNSSAWKKEATVPVMGEIDTNLRLIETYKQIMKSDRMGSKLALKLGVPYSKSELGKKIRIESDDGSQIITIVAYEKTAEQAAKLLNTYVAIFQEEIRTLMNLDNVTILKEVKAGTDTKQMKIKSFFYMVLPFILSLTIYLMIIIATEIYSPLFNSERKLERALQLPLLGTIHSPNYKFSNYVQQTIPQFPSTNFLRATAPDFGKLAANLHYLVKQKNMKTFMMTSPNPGDGKTFIGGHLAVTLAMDDKKTLYVDADFRNSDGRTLFDLPERKGLTSVISGNYKVEEIIQETGIENLSFISTGPLPSNPIPFLLSGKMENLMEELKTMFEVIIVDSPALTVADAVSLLPLMDGCLFVVDARSTTEKTAMEGFKSLIKVNGNVIGAVLNGVETKQKTHEL